VLGKNGADQVILGNSCSGVSSGLCQNCAKTLLICAVGVSFEQQPVIHRCPLSAQNIPF
jgi:hypothetical protein